MRPLVLLSLPVAVVFADRAAAQRAAAPFPLERGLTWTYRGIVRSSGGTDQRVRTDTIEWTMRIVAVKAGPNVRAALVRGWVQDLAWHEPGNEPKYSTLVARDGRLYSVAATDSANAADALEGSIRPGALPPPVSELVIDSTLSVNHVYAQDSLPSKRDDFLYGWHVASVTSVAAPAAWRAGTARVRQIRLEYRTLPDHQQIDLVPGIGIARFVYSHHGSVADTDVRLVSVTR